MRKQKFICALSALFIVISCSGDNTSGGDLISEESEAILTEQEAKVLFRMREPDNRVSMDEVTKLANDAISMLDGEALVKSGSARRINSISALIADSKPALKSGDFGDIEVPDTLAYILNFNDSLGFAIISADTRIDEPLLAFTESGTLIDSTDNPGIAIFLERLEDYMLNSIAEAEEQKDSLLDGIMGKLGTEASTKADDMGFTIIETPWDTVIIIPPLVFVNWGQEALFNDYLSGRCVKDNGSIEEYPAGCVAVAVGQIMSRWRYPEIINDFKYEWQYLNNFKTHYAINNAIASGNGKWTPDMVMGNVAKVHAGLLMKAIGEGVSMDYGCKGSGSSIDKSVSFLSKFGFKTSGIKSYDSLNVLASLIFGRPVLARGCSEKIREQFLGITYNTYHDGCHQWVIDGYLKRKKILAIKIINNIYTDEINADYLYNNWGWYGSYNGYFLSGVFDAKSTHFPYTKSDNEYNFQYDIKTASIYK